MGALKTECGKVVILFSGRSTSVYSDFTEHYVVMNGTNRNAVYYQRQWSQVANSDHNVSLIVAPSTNNRRAD